MPCYSYVFVGHVHPMTADVTVGTESFTIDFPSEDGPILGLRKQA